MKKATEIGSKLWHKAVGENLRAARLLAGFKTYKAASRAAGVPESCICMYETCKRRGMRVECILRLCRAYRCPIGAVLEV